MVHYRYNYNNDERGGGDLLFLTKVKKKRILPLLSSTGKCPYIIIIL